MHLLDSIREAMVSLKGLNRIKLIWEDVESLGWEMYNPGKFRMLFNFTTKCNLNVYLHGQYPKGNLLLQKNGATVFFGNIENISELKKLLKRHGLIEIY